MTPIVYLFIISAGIISGGALIIYAIESPHEESQIQTYLDAFWWAVATATTVGYGDVVPVTELGRIISLFFMFFGIAFIATFFSVLGTTFYKRKFHTEDELSHGHQLILDKLSELERQQKEHSKIINELKEKLKEKETS